MIFMKRIYLQHFNRGDDCCPLCQSALRWRKTGDRKWTPCDKIPVSFCFEETGKERVVFKGEIVSKVMILRKDNARAFIGKKLYSGLEPHVFTCTARKRFTAFQKN